MLIELSLIFFISSLAMVFFQVPFWMSFFLKKGKTGIDIHKENRPVIPEMCGVAILISLTVLGVILYIIVPNLAYITVISVALIGGIIGLIDDLVDLGGKVKPLLTLLASIPIFILGQYQPHPALPFIPSTRLTIIYPILIPLGIAISTNAVNMLNVVNGSTPLLLMPIFLSLMIISFIQGSFSPIPVIALALGALLAFYFYNKYPARAFMGNNGDFFLGAYLGAIAITFHLEVATLVAMFPYIMHGFYALSSVGRLFEHKEIRNKPVVFRSGLLYSSSDPQAPMTLLRLIVLKQPLSEKQVGYVFFFMSCLSSTLAVITSLLTNVRLL
ncbi:MAG TPA: hypothetical protein VKU94_06085 [Geobacterales bacterium]|nr:hypothetical protein [Geobacterales bacterium]